MADGFQVARLIPVSGINNTTEAEMRATSALLSVLMIVRDLSAAMFSPLGASTARKASVEAFIETRFKLNDGTVIRPDGVVQVAYGASTWKTLVEVKTGDNLLQADQLNNYLTLAREQGFDAVVTISNEIGVGAEHPCEGVRVRANSKVCLAHFSWTEVLGHAVQAKVHRGVSDPEQAWILGELIRYLKHPASGAMAFADMGANWATVRDASRTATLHKSDSGLRDIVHRWEQLVRFAALRLGSKTGVDVQPVVPRAHSDPKVRFNHLADQLIASGHLDAALRIPGSVGEISLVVDLRARQITASTKVPAPTDRGSRARITWLLRQLGDAASGDLAVEAWPRHSRQPICTTLAQARENRDMLLDPDRREILRFRLIQRAEMGQNRKDGGRSPGFIQSVTAMVEAFYENVLQQIVPWTARPPQTRSTTRPQDLVDDPIMNPEDLDEAVVAARANAVEKARDESRALSVSVTRQRVVDNDSASSDDELGNTLIAMARSANTPDATT
ncbi:MAG: hypothetical protein ACRD2C_06480 [Acidimicrobiales bacterium]